MSGITKFDQKSLTVALKAISKGAVKTRDQIQKVAVWAVATSIMNGDVSVANMLYEALGGTKSLRKDSLAAYFERYGNLAWGKEDKKFGFLANSRHGITDGKLTADYEAIIVGSMWDSAKKENETVSTYDMETQLRTFLGKMEKHVLEPANTIKNRDVLQAVAVAFNRIVAEKTLAGIKALDEADTKAAKDHALDNAETEPAPKMHNKLKEAA
jgi:hypothetical protein